MKRIWLRVSHNPWSDFMDEYIHLHDITKVKGFSSRPCKNLITVNVPWWPSFLHFLSFWMYNIGIMLDEQNKQFMVNTCYLKKQLFRLWKYAIERKPKIAFRTEIIIFPLDFTASNPFCCILKDAAICVFHHFKSTWISRVTITSRVKYKKNEHNCPNDVELLTRLQITFPFLRSIDNGRTQIASLQAAAARAQCHDTQRGVMSPALLIHHTVRCTNRADQQHTHTHTHTHTFLKRQWAPECVMMPAAESHIAANCYRHPTRD